MSDKNKKYRCRVLVVEDEWLVRWSIEKTLIKHEFDVLSMESSTEALEVIKNNPLDWIVTDLKMPEINGLKLIQAMKDSNPHGKAILITAFGTARVKKQAKQLGALFIKKPFDVDRLVNKIVESQTPSNQQRNDLSN